MTKPPLIPSDMPDARLRSLIAAMDGDGPIIDAQDLLMCLRLSRGHVKPERYIRQVEVHGALAAMAGTLAKTYSKDVLALALVYGQQSALYTETLGEAGERLATSADKLRREVDGWDRLLKLLAVWQELDSLDRRRSVAARKPARKAKGRAAL